MRRLCGLRSPVRRAFTLVELLVVVAVVATLLGLLAPALASARRSAWGVACSSNLRQVGMASREFSDANRGLGPALGWPWTERPNWAVVALEYAGESRGSPADPFETAARDGETALDSILICPATARASSVRMTRTYGVNVTGHAGMAGDRGNYDAEGEPARVRFDLVERPSETPMAMDTAVAFFPSNAPPPTRTSSVVDFRTPAHVERRLGRVHPGSSFNVVRFDGSVGASVAPEPLWARPLP